MRECAAALCYGVFDEIADLTLRRQSATPCGAEVTAALIQRAQRYNHQTQRDQCRQNFGPPVEHGKAPDHKSQSETR